MKILITENQLNKILTENINGKYIVYHGTNANFDEFDSSEIGTNSQSSWNGYGFYFSDNINESKLYGDIILKCEITLYNPIDLTKNENTSINGSGIIRLLGDLKGFSSVEIPKLKRTIGELDSIIRELENNFNPDKIQYEEKTNKLFYDLTDKDFITINNIQPNEYENQEYIKSLIIRHILDNKYNIDNIPIRIKDFMNPYSFTLLAKENGYDGVINANSTAFSGNEYVVFDSDQIKILENFKK